ncbi:hypothetical protein M5689_018794 [Euphorbia peplus]|nr:hypothetical protein M5689_018794 [Euphorbia peplus]
MAKETFKRMDKELSITKKQVNELRSMNMKLSRELESGQQEIKTNIVRVRELEMDKNRLFVSNDLLSSQILKLTIKRDLLAGQVKDWEEKHRMSKLERQKSAKYAEDMRQSADAFKASADQMSQNLSDQ